MKAKILVSLVIGIFLVGLVNSFEVKLNVKNITASKEDNRGVTGGIALPQGLMNDVDTLRITDESGKELPAQFRILSRWWSEKYPKDRSVRWVLIDFIATVKSNGSTIYYLKDGGKGTAKLNDIISEMADEVIVNTGVIKFTLNKKEFKLFDQVWVDDDKDGLYSDKELLVSNSKDDGLVITSAEQTKELYMENVSGCRLEGQDNRPHPITARPSVVHSAVYAIPQITIEEQGPIKGVIRISGTHLAKEGGIKDGLYEYVMRLYVYRGQSMVRVVHSLRNARAGKTEMWLYPFKDYSIITSVKWDKDPSYLCYGDKAKEIVQGGLKEGELISFYQDSSGGNNWNDSKVYGVMFTSGFRYDANKCTVSDGVSFRGYKVTKGTEVISNGNKAIGFTDLSDGRRGVTVGIRYFWQNYPKAIDFEKGKVVIRLWPKYFSGKIKKRPTETYFYGMGYGEQKTHEVLFDFHSGSRSNDELKAVANIFQYSPKLTVDSGYYVKANSYLWETGTTVNSTLKIEQCGGETRDLPDVGWQRFSGYDYYPYFSDWVACGGHIQDISLFTNYIQSGNPADFYNIEPLTLLFMDRIYYHLDLNITAEDELKTAKTRRYYYFPEYHGERLSFSGGSYDSCWGMEFHCGFLGKILLEYYYLTGDAQALEAAYEFEVQQLYALLQCRRLGGKDVNINIIPYANKHAANWIVNLIDVYEGVRESTYLPEVNRKYGEKMWKETKELEQILVKNIKSNARGYYRSYIPVNKYVQFQGLYIESAIDGGHGVGVDGMYYLLQRSKCEELEDVLIGLGDFVYNEVYDKNKPKWTDRFGFPYQRFVPDASNKIFNEGGGYPGMDYLLGWWGVSLVHSYRLTGKLEYWSVAKNIYNGIGRPTTGMYTGMYFQGYLREENRMQNRDKIKPQAISDLRMEKGEDGKTKLVWTAPGDDIDKGKATRYKIKYSLKPIVERVKWDDKYFGKENELPEWSFWGSENVSDESIPMEAGTKQEYIPKNLVDGKKYYFAIKTYDEDNNESELSNIVETTGPFTGIGDNEVGAVGNSNLHQNYPNPFNPECFIPYEVGNNCKLQIVKCKIRIYNILGQVVKELDLGEKQVGSYVTKDKAAYWDGRDAQGKEVVSGVYYYELVVNGKVVGVKKSLVVK